LEQQKQLMRRRFVVVFMLVSVTRASAPVVLSSGAKTS